MPAKQKSKPEKAENPSAFKHFVNPEVVKSIASEFKRVDPSFRDVEFAKVSKELGPLELKQRVLLIAERMKEFLPKDYRKAVALLVKVIKNDKLDGFQLWPFSEYIGQMGLEHFDLSMNAMYEMTSRFTSEFAIRPYFLKDQKEVLRYFEKWATDKNHHIRRWVSEGSRPLLPWGARLPAIVKDPTPTLALLEKLKYDDEIYVRKSVANHLNDISKHNPAKVVQTLKAWNEKCPEEHQTKITWITRHALRTLIKKGDLNALKLIGVGAKPKIKIGPVKPAQKTVKLNQKLDFEFDLASTASKSQKLAIDYAIGFVKSNGKIGHKVYKLKTIELKAGEKVLIQKAHSFKPITTMKYFSGTHELVVQINGEKHKPVYFEVRV